MGFGNWKIEPQCKWDGRNQLVGLMWHNCGCDHIMYQNSKICCEEIFNMLAKMSDKSFGEIDMAIKRVLVLIEPRNTEILFAF